MNHSPIDNLSEIAVYAVRNICKDNPMVFYEIEFEDGLYDNGEVYSFDEKHRIALWRVWDYTKPTIMYVSFNPTDRDTDAVLDRCKKRTEFLNFGGFVLVNLFTYITPDPGVVKMQQLPVLQPICDEAISGFSTVVNSIVCMWGGNGKHQKRSEEVINQLLSTSKPVFVLGWTLHKEPKHALKVPNKSKLIKYNE